MNKKVLTIIVIIIALIAAWFFWGGSSSKDKSTYTLGRAENGYISESIDATGIIEPVRQVDLSAKISGTLREVNVRENEWVQRGQVLAVIEAKAAESQLAQAESILNNKRSLYNRYHSLYEQGAVSYQTLADAQMNYETAQATYDKALADIRDTVITAPMDGVVLGEPMEEGEMISQGVANQMIIVTVADLNKLRIRLLVDETDVGKIKVGQRVTFTVDAYPDREFNGRVSDISRKEDKETSTNVVYYRVYVNIEENGSDVLYPSMTARAIVYGKEQDDTLIIPITALRSDEEGQYVFRKSGEQLEKAYVKLGVVTDSKAEVLSGITGSDDIVVSGSVPEDKAGHEVRPFGIGGRR